MQVKLKRKEIEALELQIERDWRNAQESHTARIGMNRRYTNAFLAAADGADKNADDCMYKVPLIQEKVLTAVARTVSQLLGPGARVMADPVGDSDVAGARRAAAFAHWGFFNHMRPIREMAMVMIRRELYGRAFVFSPWEERTRPDGKVYWRGPGFYPISPDDFYHPAQRNARTVQDFEWVIRRFWESARTLRAGIESGLYPLIPLEDVDELVHQAATFEEDLHTRDEEDEAEGLDYASELLTTPQESRRGWLEVHEWYGWFRVGRRDMQLVCRALRRNQWRLASVEDLVSLYPEMPVVRPILETARVSHGPYYPMSTAFQLESAQLHLTDNFRFSHGASQFASSPPMFGDPTTVDAFDASEPLRPGMLYRVRNPAGLKQLDIRYDPNSFLMNEAAIRADAERATGQSDFAAGRDVDRPTAPRTATGLVTLVQQGNIRLGLDTTMQAEDLATWLKYWHALWKANADDGVEFRVTEMDASSYALPAGSKRMFETAEEQNGEFDFRLRFALSDVEKEQIVQRIVQAYQLLMANPLFMSSPRAVWCITTRMLRELGFADIAAELPEPADTISRPPSREHAMIQQGEKVAVRPGDDHQAHLTEHYAFLDKLQKAQNPDPGAIQALTEHIAETNRAKAAADMAASLMNAVIDSIGSNDAMSGGLTTQPQALPIEELLGAAQNKAGQQQ